MEEFTNKTASYSTIDLIRNRCLYLIRAFKESAPKSTEDPKEIKIIDYHFNINFNQIKVLYKEKTALFESHMALIAEKENCNKRNVVQCLAKLKKNDLASIRLNTEIRRLSQSGFKTWTRKNFLRFVEAFNRFGRMNIEAIALIVVEKTWKEVQEYSDVFWKRYDELEEDVIRNLAEDVLDREMVVYLQDCIEKKGIPTSDNETDYQLMLILRDIPPKNLMDVMDVIIHKSGDLLQGKTHAQVRSRCNRIMKTLQSFAMPCDKIVPQIDPNEVNSSVSFPNKSHSRKSINPLNFLRKMNATKVLIPSTSTSHKNTIVDLTSDDSLDGLDETTTSRIVTEKRKGLKRSMSNSLENEPKIYKTNWIQEIKIDRTKDIFDDDSDIEIIE